ncbi:MAG: hypothetical protein SH848_01120 [Saprospiraceae bacterium]|nr:hypothetical protein [Saprospiraceae bacterium]MDZ4702496.1 hypothetical protein [Saprospiraceae bacterium]
MNRRHPIDDLFRARLEDHGQDAPMHLWEAIERSRSIKPRRRLAALWLLPLTAIGALALYAYWSRDSSVVSIQSFPIPMTSEKPVATVTPAEPALEAIAAENRSATAEIAQQKKSSKSFAPLASTQIAGQLEKLPLEINPNPTNLAPEESLSTEHPEKMTNQETATTIKTASILPALALEPVTFEDKELLKRLFPPDPKCARFSPGNWYHYVDVTLSSGFAFRNLEALDSEYEDYLEQRENTEKSRHTFGAGVRLTAVSDFGLAARAGLNYTQITEAFDYLNENEVRITITNVYGNNGEIVRTDTTYVSGTRRIVTPNQYQIVEIPLAVGYDLRSPKFDLLLSVGVRINLLFQQKGAFLSPEDLTPVNFSYNRADAYPAFKKRLETAWFVSAGLAYKWKPDFHFIFEPHLSYYLDSFTKPEFPVSQKYWLFGASIGIRKRL